MILHSIPLPGGLRIAAHEAGPRDAPTVLFVHGIAQNKRAFDRVLTGPLARTHRLVALDLRGHGDADTPHAGVAITRASLVEDLRGVIDHLQLVRPWLAGWSFGGSMVGEYLRRHGDGDLGGILMLAGAVRTGRDAVSLFGPGMMTHARALLSEDEATYAAACRGFIADASHAPVAPATMDAMVAEMLRVPAHVRRPLLAGGEDYLPAFAATRVPIATLHGELDTVVLPAMSDLVATARRDVAAIRIPGAGHMPWTETPEAFDSAVGALIAR
jgi:non-heme chloroperoxidase